MDAGRGIGGAIWVEVRFWWLCTVGGASMSVFMTGETCLCGGTGGGSLVRLDEELVSEIVLLTAPCKKLDTTFG